jgi:isoaspartyl peptidase/L-asparaginase-like protein (Ntn-hydrolase superfamily)
MDCSEACVKALKNMSTKICQPGGDGGAIVITKTGEVGYGFNSKNMGWAFIKGGKLHYGIQHDEVFVEDAE